MATQNENIDQTTPKTETAPVVEKESDEKAEKKRRRWHKYDEFTVETGLECAPLKSLNFALFCIESVYAIVLLALGYNFLAVCAIAFSMGFALWICLQVVLRGYVNIWTAGGLIVSDVSLMLYFFIWGAEGELASRFGINLVFTLLPIAVAAVTLFVPAMKKLGKKRLVASCLAVFMVGVSVFYFLAASFRAKPTVKSMQEGHDDYLNSLDSSSAKQRPNVLFVLMDDMGYADISMYSYLNAAGKEPTIHTPNIDSIAQDGGIYFENFYASSPVCSPSRFGILTGRYCSRGYLDNVVFPSKVSLAPFGNTRYFNPFQFLNNVDGILGDEITFAEVMQRVGYSTALFGKWNLGDYGEYLPTNQGFDYFYGSHYVNDMTPYNFVEESGGQFKEVFSHAEMKDQSVTTSRISAKMNPYLEKQIEDYEQNGKPFFTYYCTPWPHAPLYSSNNTTSEDLDNAVKGDTTDDSYVDNIEEFDHYLGQTLDILRAHPDVYDNTIIIFTSDNGPGREGATGALKGRKNTTFEGGHKVPMLVHYGKNLRTDMPVTLTDAEGNPSQSYCVTASYMNIDIFPTLLDYMGVDMPTDRIIDGVSMKGVLEGSVAQDATVKDADGNNRVLYYIKKGTVQSLQMAIEVDELGKDGKPTGNKVTYDFKYYLNVLNENSAFIDQYYKNYMFNLDVDPIEGYNVSMTYVDAAKTCKNTLLNFRKSLKNNRRGIL